MIRTLIVLIFTAVISLPSLAETYVQQGGSADTEVRRDHRINLAQETNLQMTLSCQLGGNNSHLRVYVYFLNHAGRWQQINDLQVIRRGNTPETKGTFKLPAGQYTVTVSARQMQYSVLIEDAPAE